MLKYSRLIITIMICLFSITVQGQKKEKIKINLGWYHQFQFAGFYAAKELGYYEEAGLDVSLLEDEGISNADWVFKNNGYYGIASSGQLLSDPKRDSLLVVAIIFQQSPISLITRKIDSINTLKDLVGKTINAGPEIKAMIKSAGVSLESINVRGPLAYLDQLSDSNSQAVSYYITDQINYNGTTNEDYKIFRPIEFGISFYGESLYTSQRELMENPERVEKMYVATLRGWQYAIEHPDQVIDIILEKYGSRVTREALEHESQIVINSLIIPALFELGYSDKNKWAQIAKALRTFGLMENEEMDWENFIYNSQKNKANQKLAEFARIAVILAIIFLVVVAILFLYNLSLRRTVSKRTRIIEAVNSDIQLKNDELANQKVDLEKLNYFKDRILSILSHDIRGPLHTFQGLINLIGTHSLTEKELDQLLSGTGAQISEVTGFLDSLLFWAKNQLHGIQVNPQNLSISHLVKETVAILSMMSQSKGISISNMVSTDINVNADPDLINLVLRNIISNSIKFCSKGDEITISLENQKDFVKVLVKDNGPGMTKEQISKCFKIDMKSTSGTEDEVGSGLGLLMCKEFVELNGGEIGVESEENNGSCFWFTLMSSSSI